MATKTKYLCPKCGEAQWYSLFESLSAKAGNGLKCSKPECKGELEMQLTFSFGFHGKVVGAFLPDDIKDWYEGKAKQREHWEFYPFLVVIESLKKNEPGQVIWQPYWHKVTAKDKSLRTPYGQWATCLDLYLFQQLLKKAKKKGFFKGK